MNRRDFLAISGAFVGLSVSKRVFSGQMCGPFMPSGIQLCRAGINSNIAFRVARIQEQDQWCWAACIQMIFLYYGYHISQSRIVAETWGNVVNMPASDFQIMSDLNRPWRDDRGRVFRAYSARVDPQAASRELAIDMPLIICTTGHAMVLTAMDFVRDSFGNGEVKKAIVRDPWKNNGRRSLTKEEWYNTQLIAGIRCG